MEKIDSILISVLKISESDLNKNISIGEIPTWDSLSHMNLIIEIENEYNIQLSGDDIADMISFESIRKIVNNYING